MPISKVSKMKVSFNPMYAQSTTSVPESEVNTRRFKRIKYLEMFCQMLSEDELNRITKKMPINKNSSSKNSVVGLIKKYENANIDMKVLLDNLFPPTLKEIYGINNPDKLKKRANFDEILKAHIECAIKIHPNNRKLQYAILFLAKASYVVNDELKNSTDFSKKLNKLFMTFISNNEKFTKIIEDYSVTEYFEAPLSDSYYETDYTELLDNLINEKIEKEKAEKAEKAKEQHSLKTNHESNEVEHSDVQPIEESNVSDSASSFEKDYQENLPPIAKERKSEFQKNTYKEETTKIPELNTTPVKEILKRHRILNVDRTIAPLDKQIETRLTGNSTKLVGVIERIIEKNSKFFNFYPILECVNGSYREITQKEALDIYSSYGSIRLEHDMNRSNIGRLEALGNMSLITIIYHSYELDKNPYDGSPSILLDDVFKENRIFNSYNDPVLSDRACYIVTPLATDEELDFSKTIYVEFKEYQLAKNFKFNNRDVVLNIDGFFYGPFPVHYDSKGDYFVRPTDNNKSYDHDRFLLQQLSPSKNSIIDMYLRVFKNPVFWLSPNETRYETYDCATDKDILKMYEELGYIEFSCEGFDEFAEGRTIRLAQLLENIQKKKDLEESYKNIFIECIKKNPEYLTTLAKVLNQNPEEAQKVATSLGLNKLLEGMQQEEIKTQARLEGLKEELKQLNDDSEKASAKLEETKELYSKFKDLEAANEECIRLKEESQKYKEEIAKDTQRFMDMDGGLKKYEDRIKQTSDLVASLAFNDEITAKIMDASNSGEKNLEVRNRADRFESIKNLKLVEYKDEKLVNYLCDTLEENRSYNFSQLEYINLLTCVTQNFLTVISGAPGSGKTSICNILGHSLGLTDIAQTLKGNEAWGEQRELANRYVPVSVERGWTSKRDFIGYFNPLTRTFESTDPHRYECFRQLDKEATQGFEKLPYLILLDEANLSPMEYYFADFMNICDSRKSNNTIALSGSQKYHIPDTLRFLATINNDHTTDRLSPRLIDRSFIVILPNEGKQNESAQEKQIQPINWEYLKAAFSKGDIEKNTLKNYEDLKETLEKVNIPLSYRSDNAIRKYIKSASYWMSKSTDCNKASRSGQTIALDFAIAQKALPFIDVLGDSYHEALEDLAAQLENFELTKSLDIVRRIIKNGSEMDDYRFFKF